EPERASEVARLAIEIPEHLDVIGEEADRADDDLLLADLGERLEVRLDVGLEPRDVRRTRAALKDELPLAPAEALGDEAAGVLELRDVIARVRHRDGDRMGREHQARLGVALVDAVERLGEA